MRTHPIVASATLAVLLVTGISHAADADAEDVLVRQHFSGLSALNGRTNLASLQSILRLPQSEELLSGLSLKLAAHAPVWFGASAAEPVDQAKLQPSLRALLQAESYLEVRGTADRVTGWAWASRLDAPAASALSTNLAALLARLLNGNVPAAEATSWEIPGRDRHGGVRFLRTADWVVLGSGTIAFERFQKEIQSGNGPMAADTNDLLQVEADLERIARLLKWPEAPPGPLLQWPKVSVRVEPRAGGLRTSAELACREPLSFSHEPWELPTSVLREPLVGFTALRGADRWLSRSRFLSEVGITNFPEQLFFWSLGGPMWQQYFAGSVNQATNVIQAAGGLALKVMTNSTWAGLNFRLRYTNQASRVELHGLPYFAPFLHVYLEEGKETLFGGLFLASPSGTPAPPELLSQVQGRTNLIYYDWETHWRTVSTNPPGRPGPRLETNLWGRLSQFLDLAKVGVALRTPVPQIPRNRSGQIDVPGLEWAQAAIPHLGNTITEVTQTGPRQLSVVRQSQAGFNSIEWIYLLRWLENPGFPGWQPPLVSPPRVRGPAPTPEARDNP
jgi:hypothetical protein